MPAAEFEEREYESAALVELADGGGAVFTPGQVLEKIVGYDSVAAPVREHILWRLLRVPRPRGLALVPTLWPAAARPTRDVLPSTPVSVVLQYKRPEYLRAPQASQWRLWGRDYYRVERRDAQHRILRNLETRAGDAVVVRYVSPAFWRRGDLEQAHLRRTVLSRSGFVAPSSFGRHRVWTYIEPGTDGQFNPRNARVTFETYSSLTSRWAAEFEGTPSGLPARREVIPEHLATVARAASYRNPAIRKTVQTWMRAVVSADLGLSQRDLVALSAYATIASTSAHVGAVWFIADTADGGMTGTQPAD